MTRMASGFALSAGLALASTDLSLHFVLLVDLPLECSDAEDLGSSLGEDFAKWVGFLSKAKE